MTMTLLVGRLYIALALYLIARIRFRRFIRIQRGHFFRCALSGIEHSRASVRQIETTEGRLAICERHGILHEAFEPGSWE